ncbi:MAG: hypothetical protein K1X86_00045 [Ignavibacteria bacterium]|nr:hypothetical protein [Ignavibacteria bacterium]
MKKLLFLLYVNLLCVSVNAQVDKFTEKVEKVAENKFVAVSNDPSNSSSLVNFISSLSLTSTLDEQSGTANVGYRKGSWSFSGVIKQSFSKKPNKVTFFDLDGLGGETSIKFSLQYFHWKPKRVENFKEVLLEYCKDAKLDSASCSQVTSDDLTDKYYNKLEFDYGFPMILGASFGMSKASFDYISDSLSVNPLSSSKINKEARVLLGMMINNGDVLALSFSYQAKYTAKDPMSLIFPLNSSQTFYTKEVSIGEPKLSYLRRYKLEYKNATFGYKFVINPSITFIATGAGNNKIAVEFPIYFLNQIVDKEPKGLNGGVALGYVTKSTEFTKFEDGFGGALFISAPFELFGF